MSELTIYPWPSSHNEFCERNPEVVDLYEQLHAIAQEIVLWKATSPEVDLEWADLDPAVLEHRKVVEQARNTGGTIVELAEWPRVGDYEVPDDLRLAA